MTETPPPRRALATFLRRPARDGQPREESPASESSQADAPASTPAADESPVASPPAEAAVVPPAAPAPASANAESETETDAASDTHIDSPAPAPVADWRVAELPIASPTPPLAATAALGAAAAPTFARPRVRARAPRASAWQWMVLAALALLLVMQILLADRARLAADARWRPVLSGLCGMLHCELPVWHEPTAFTMLDRDVRPAPGETGVLRIQASFRNDARWQQAWPWLQLSLSDADGRVIGSRVFSPAEYLGQAPEPGQTLAPGQSGRVDFRVREPAAGTAAFTFDFH
ncbi:MAG TPA: DUF3426 domain-containing protein [Stenotrophomonas sp.]|nr:DUF3426 domain-containing protein [Stenotrophomonas sp.]